jgi:orotidine-5'-phosphate decarboxylase
VVNPILVALDFSTGDEAMTLAESVEPHVGGFKVGLELIMGDGPTVVERIVSLGKPVFCDVKLHDIPNTVEAAARQLGRLGVRWITVHAAGGEAMMRAAVGGLVETAPGPAGVLAVTVLTSLSADDLPTIGVPSDPRTQVTRLAALADASGVEGVVCSVAEVEAVAASAPRLVTVTPGIRPGGADPGDQARVATPASAITAGADLLVVGRPITRAPDPVASARAIAAEATAHHDRGR